MSNKKPSPPVIRKGRRLKALTQRREWYRQNAQQAAASKNKEDESFWTWLADAATTRIKAALRDRSEREASGRKVGGCIGFLTFMVLVIIASTVIVYFGLFSWDQAARFLISVFGPHYGLIIVVGALAIVIGGLSIGGLPRIRAWFVAIGRGVGGKGGRIKWGIESHPDDLDKFPSNRS